MKEILNKILLGDNIDLMKKISSNSIDLIFADPPYNMNLQKDLLRFNGNKFDGVTDEWDKYNSLKEYDNECRIWMKECLRILKQNGSLWVIGSFHNIHRLGYILQDMGAWIINEIVWEKSNPVPNFGGTRFVNSQETMLWIVKNKKAKFTFNYKTMKQINGGTQMRSVWKFSICTGNNRLKDSQGRKIHSTQKPLELLERIILANSKVGDVVLDPFSGTGTTAHAAKKWGRNYIGMEQCKKYFDASVERLKNVCEEIRNDDLKFATYDVRPRKVKFKELLDNKLISTKDEINIKNTDYKLHFNNDGSVNFLNEKMSPNKICKIVFSKPTNSWEWMTVNDVPLKELRNKIRNSNCGS